MFHYMSVLTRRNKYTYLMLISFSSNKFQRDLSGCTGRGGGVLLKILCGGVPHSSPNRDLISDQKISFFTSIFRPGLKNPYPFSDLAS